MKRVLTSAAGLNINSTIANVTLPYFSVDKLEWIPDPEVLPQNQRNMSMIENSLTIYSAVRQLVLGMGALVPYAPWNDTALLFPSTISETRLLVLTTHWMLENNTTKCGLEGSTVFRSLPSSMGFIEHEYSCYAFARITYSAGAGVCTNCRLSSYSTVQNETTLSLQPDVTTLEALRLMPDTTTILTTMTSSIPNSWENEVNDYLIEVLSRSYAGAWTALTYQLGRKSVSLTSSFIPALPSLQAQVDLKRVYIWFAMQLLVTLFGIIFLVMQFETKYRLMGTTTLAAFELDATEATTEDGRERLRNGEVLKLQPKDGGLKIVIEASGRNYR